MDDIVPIALFAMIAALVLGPIYLGSKSRSEEKARMHETLRQAFDKGQPLPPDLLSTLQQDKPRSTPERDFRTGVILVAVALAFLVSGWTIHSVEGDDELIAVFSAMAAFPGLIGLAFLAFWLGKRGRSTDISA